MVTLIILWVFSIPATWLLTGLLRALKPSNAKWYFLGYFNKILWILNGSKSLPIIPLPWPFRHIELELEWKEYEKPNKKYEGKNRTYQNINSVIGTRKEMTSIRHLEEHPMEVFAILKDGHKAVLILDVTLEVFDPKLLIPRKNFLFYAEQKFGDILLPWAKENKDIDSILKVEIEEVKKITFDIYGKDHDIVSFLNKEKFEPYGFRIKELSLKIGLTEESDEYFNIQTDIKKQEQKKILAEKKEEVREIERKTASNDADTEREIQKKDLEVTASYQGEMVDKIYGGRAKVARSYKAKVLVLGGNQDSEKDLVDTKSMTNAIVSNLVAHKRMDKKTKTDDGK